MYTVYKDSSRDEIPQSDAWNVDSRNYHTHNGSRVATPYADTTQNFVQTENSDSGETRQNRNSDSESFKDKINDKKRRIVRRVKKNLDRKVDSVSTAFPFTLFPDHIIANKNKVDIIFNHIIGREVFSIFISDIRNIELTHGIFFSSLFFEVRGFERNPDPVRFLWPEDATRIRSVILGLSAAQKEGIDMNLLSGKEIKKQFEDMDKNLLPFKSMEN